MNDTASPLEALADELGAVAARIEREVRLQVAAAIAEMREEMSALRATRAELELHAERTLAGVRSGEAGAPGMPGEPGPPGESITGPQGPPGALTEPREWIEGDVYYQAEIVTLSGSTWYARRDTASRPPGDDWALVAAAGRDAPIGEVCGLHDPARVYRQFDLVVRDGAEWRARHDNPGALPGAGWALSAEQGKRGKPGERGEKGEKGAEGPTGKPVPVIIEWALEEFRAVPLMSDGTTGPVLDMRGFFDLYDRLSR